MERRKRRRFTPEFKADTVRLIRESGKSIGQVCKDLGLTETSVRNWVKQADVDAGRGAPGALTSEEREELRRLRKENRVLKTEREILKKAAVGSARQGNTVRKDFARRLEAEGLSRTSIELSSRLVQRCLGVAVQTSPLWKVLPEQSVGVFVGATLPWALWVAKVEFDVSVDAELSVLG